MCEKALLNLILLGSISNEFVGKYGLVLVHLAGNRSQQNCNSLKK